MQFNQQQPYGQQQYGQQQSQFSAAEGLNTNAASFTPGGGGGPTMGGGQVMGGGMCGGGSTNYGGAFGRASPDFFAESA